MLARGVTFAGFDRDVFDWFAGLERDVDTVTVESVPR